MVQYNETQQKVRELEKKGEKKVWRREREGS
jgi:hypothetical protein